jgi:diketogulonate reductase-like aldo/keto reductase
MRHSNPSSPERRLFLGALAAGAAGVALGGGRSGARAAAGEMMHERKIRSGEAIPVIGLGTYDTFDVGTGADERAPLVEVVKIFAAAGGKVIDSSPMYGRAESVVGEVLPAAGRPPVFLATKVWTRGKGEGIEQMQTSMRRMGSPDRMDLMQVHNLLDWRTHLPVLREWKAGGKLRYIGVTHYQVDAFGELEQIIAKEKIDFVQLPYSLAMRAAEKRLLPAAAANGVGVIVMRPFEKGGLFQKVKDRPLPPIAAEIEAASWAQLFLKFIVSHPAVTVAIPATGKPKHIADNVRAGFGRMPTEAQRQALAALF